MCCVLLHVHCLATPMMTWGCSQAASASQGVAGYAWVCSGSFDPVSVTWVTLSHKWFFVMHICGSSESVRWDLNGLGYVFRWVFVICCTVSIHQLIILWLCISISQNIFLALFGCFLACHRCQKPQYYSGSICETFLCLLFPALGTWLQTLLFYI